jgi:glutamate carboxypeptidase
LLEEWVGVNSFTLNRTGVTDLARLTRRAFAPLGFAAESVPSFNPDFADHLVLLRKGRGPHTVAFLSHLDTVFPPDEEAANDFRWREEGERIYGPGTLDIKGGTALVHQILCALQDVAPNVFEETNWLFLLNSSEEMPSPDFGRLCRDRIPTDAAAALVMEGGARAGSSHALVTARKGRAVFRVCALGRAAHAGNRHRRGINAIAQLAHTVMRLDALTDHNTGLTVNVGVLSGGTIVNRVPHQAGAEVEVRAFDPTVYRDGLQAIHTLETDVVIRSLEDGKPCEVRVVMDSQVPPWPPNPATDSLFENWRSVGRDLGMTMLRQERGGLSDANRVWDHVATLDGLGPCGDHAHCSQRSADGSMDQEYVEKDSFVPRAMLNCAGLLKLLQVQGTGLSA